MTTKVTGLKKPTGKGLAPKRGDVTQTDPLKTNTRDGEEEVGHIQFRVPISKIESFNRIALERHGSRHGNKTKLFIEMIEKFEDM